MKWNYHNWGKTVVDKDWVSDKVLIERAKMNNHIDHNAKTAPNNWLKRGKKYKITIPQGCPGDNLD